MNATPAGKESPFRIGGHTVVANSGGKTSGYNLWLHLEANGHELPPHARCVFTNTGWEQPATLDFLAEQSRRWGCEIVWLEFCRVPASAAELGRLELKSVRAAERLARFNAEPPSFFVPKRAKGVLLLPHADDLKASAVAKAAKYAIACLHSWRKAQLIGTDSCRRVDRSTASLDGRPYHELLEGLLKFRNEVKGEPGVLPNGVQRICTGHLKVRLTSRFTRDLWGIKNNAFECRLGLRADEEERVNSAKEWGRDGGKATFPLHEAGVEKADVAAFWAKQPFRLSLTSHAGNCGGCHMKRRAALVDLIRRDFFDVDWWIGWEQRTGQRFRKERTYRGLVVASRTELDLIPPADFDNGITCEGGYCTD